MKIAMIGIGNIAQKAYLPILSRKRNIELILCSRNELVLERLSLEYKLHQHTTSVDDLIATGIDAAFVHSATPSHYEICKKLIENGIAVYIDKPLSESLLETRSLFQLAKDKNIMLRVGFNRRYAPLLTALKKLPPADLIIHQKNRLYSPCHIRHFVYDDFIHVVDTLRYLMSEPITDFWVSGKRISNELIAVTLHLFGNSQTAVGIMHRDSGKVEEKIEYLLKGEKRIVEDLSLSTQYLNGNSIITNNDNWVSALTQKGFEAMIDQFLDEITQDKGFNKKDEDALITHELCEAIIARLEHTLKS